MTREDYIETVVGQLSLLPPSCVIGRVTGDGARDSLLAPLWSLSKLPLIDAIDRTLFEKGIVQGSGIADYS